MPAYYYVRDHADGTGTAAAVTDAGRYATKQTGDWDTTLGGVANYYPSINIAMQALTPPVDGDFIACSNIHDHTYGITTDVDTVVSKHTIISVDDTEIETFVFGAAERTSVGGSSAIQAGISASLLIKGIEWTCTTGHIYIGNKENSGVSTEDCSVSLLHGQTVRMFVSSGVADGGDALHKRLTVRFGSVNQFMDSSGGSNVVFDDLRIDVATTVVTNLFKNNGLGGGSCVIKNSDLSNVAVGTIIGSGDAQPDDNTIGLIYGTIINAASSLFISANPAIYNFHMRAHAIKVGAAGGFTHFSEKYYGGTVIRDTAIYRTLGAQQDNENYSAEITSNANCNINFPIRYKLASINFTDGGASNKLIFGNRTFTDSITFTVHMARDDAGDVLTDLDCWCEFEFNDGADTPRGSVVSTQGDIFGTASNHTNVDATTWTGLGGAEATDHEAFSLATTLTIGAGAGNISKGAVDVLFFMAKPSQAELFIDPLVVIS